MKESEDNKNLARQLGKYPGPANLEPARIGKGAGRFA